MGNSEFGLPHSVPTRFKIRISSSGKHLKRYLPGNILFINDKHTYTKNITLNLILFNKLPIRKLNNYNLYNIKVYLSETFSNII